MSTRPRSILDLTGEVAVAVEIGNGRACAILLARQGAKVALLDNNKEWAQDTKDMIDAEDGVSEVVQVDVTTKEGVKQAVEQTVWLFVGVGGAMGDAFAVDLDAWDRDMRINVTSMVLMARHVIPHMRKQARGAIVNMSSVSGLLGGNPSLLFPITKGAIIQMT
ncbi:3-hydroxyacyl-CoA dehydrogenase type-2 [Elsinoe australis]|uniref:3-hydroxyacyl-CoA dehydrogenase type-2 n=1 Tax=Elsinoe australis TaxID=40998 RepID=A0A2P7Z6G3_9PEZI|nr:3-hydroxyacyl-CoA dehydrogenase type-2 [Elsinoe australis]